MIFLDGYPYNEEAFVTTLKGANYYYDSDAARYIFNDLLDNGRGRDVYISREEIKDRYRDYASVEWIRTEFSLESVSFDDISDELEEEGIGELVGFRNSFLLVLE